jgi:ring-1,2-phenylacetyl-CoA epoxidase subunit PaaD
MGVAAADLKSTGSDLQASVWALLATVQDPEIPILSIVDLGIVRYVRIAPGGAVHVGLTPTYAGCPATDIIRRAVEKSLVCGGIVAAHLETVLAPPWTSDWISPAGRGKLHAYGIAPPVQALASPRQLLRAAPIACPRCASVNTRKVSEFGSTPCKAHYLCAACLEPFDYFKCI